MNPISVIVITKNEAHNIGECLRSVEWCDDIVVVDAESKDDTVAIARKHTEKVFIKPWLGFAAAKQFAVEETKYDWILWLDADERVTQELAIEIQRLVAKNPSEAAFVVARRAYFLNRWIKHSGWYPGRVPRLFHKERAEFNDAAVHEGLNIHGKVGELKNDLLHFTDPNLYHYITKFNRYTTLAAEDLAKRKKKFSLADVFVRPVWLFVKMYVVKRGFLDGVQGLILALVSSAYVFTKYAKLWEKQ